MEQQIILYYRDNWDLSYYTKTLNVMEIFNISYHEALRYYMKYIVQLMKEE